MDDPRQQHGNHTWDIIIDYFRCPKCGYIIESREKYEYRLGLYQKELICNRCDQHFTVTKQMKNTFGPLLGDELNAN
jgi:uncharacterized C2H2 Zn-finger protein